MYRKPILLLHKLFQVGHELMQFFPLITSTEINNISTLCLNFQHLESSYSHWFSHKKLFWSCSNKIFLNTLQPLCFTESPSSSRLPPGNSHAPPASLHRQILIPNLVPRGLPMPWGWGFSLVFHGLGNWPVLGGLWKINLLCLFSPTQQCWWSFSMPCSYQISDSAWEHLSQALPVKLLYWYSRKTPRNT